MSALQEEHKERHNKYKPNNRSSNAATSSSETRTSFSRALSKVLRHSAAKEGLVMTPDGYVKVDDLLKLPRFKNTKLDLEMLKIIVAENDKQRFKLAEIHDDALGRTVFYIRANQGHTLSVDENALLKEIMNPTQIPLVVHGTYKNLWPLISEQGLKCMARTHIHCATSVITGENGAISGMRKSCNLLIYIDAEKAMNDGVRFFRSDNDVILTSGKDGVLSTEYFSKVVDRRDGTSYPSSS